MIVMRLVALIEAVVVAKGQRKGHSVHDQLREVSLKHAILDCDTRRQLAACMHS